MAPLRANLIGYIRSCNRNSLIVTLIILKAPIMTAADNIYKYFHCFSENIRLQKKKVKIIKVSSAAILLGSLRVKNFIKIGGKLRISSIW